MNLYNNTGCLFGSGLRAQGSGLRARSGAITGSDCFVPASVWSSITVKDCFVSRFVGQNGSLAMTVASTLLL